MLPVIDEQVGEEVLKDRSGQLVAYR